MNHPLWKSLFNLDLIKTMPGFKLYRMPFRIFLCCIIYKHYPLIISALFIDGGNLFGITVLGFVIRIQAYILLWKDTVMVFCFICWEVYSSYLEVLDQIAGHLMYGPNDGCCLGSVMVGINY